MTTDRYIRVSTDLDHIADMAARLHARALDLGNKGDGRGERILGGDAMVNLAAFASYPDWERRVELAEQPDAHGITHILDVSHEDQDDHWQPATIIDYWASRTRAALDMRPDDADWRPTLISEAGFLRNADVAAWLWDNEPRWDAYANDISRARARLETILLEGQRSERSRVTCEECDDNRPLVLIWAKRNPTTWDCHTCDIVIDDPADHEDHDLTEASWTSEADDDRWMCKGCRHKYEPSELKELFAKQTRRSGTVDKYVPLPDALDLLHGQGWQKRSVRGWLAPLKRRKRDRCLGCKAEFSPDDHTECPWCGNELEQRWYPWDREAVVQGYCEIGSRRVMLHWPSLWRRQLLERQERIMQARDAADRAAKKSPSDLQASA